MKCLTQAEKRIGELDRLFIKICEDNVKDDLNDGRFAMMSRVYEDEQAQLNVEVKNLQREIEAQEQQIENLEQFINRAHRYTERLKLAPYALRELVKAVYVVTPDKSGGFLLMALREGKMRLYGNEIDVAREINAYPCTRYGFDGFSAVAMLEHLDTAL